MYPIFESAILRVKILWTPELEIFPATSCTNCAMQCFSEAATNISADASREPKAMDVRMAVNARQNWSNHVTVAHMVVSIDVF